MRQQTLAEGGFERYRKRTSRDVFLQEMEQVVPWSELVALVEPFYPAGDGPGRSPVGSSTNCL